ncbi:synaptic vesicle glycoprotein 2B [Halyomorpha halys]|uniref:synaptic vesicle glycoprotein 2B n=1 Tax=Halyomorpha halys TaxID=286706 RepID=UPI0006D4E641|nr:synaptic vesicle glycoprotein 2B-like [Halyomorpha halys]
MEKRQEVEKKSDATLEEALDAAGSGLYTWYVVITSGLIGFAAVLSIQGMAFALPKAGCELQLPYSVRGMMSSMGFFGMLVSAQVFGFIADTFGRKFVMMLSQSATMVITVLWSLAPNTITLGIILFLNGAFLTGTFTSAYVYVGEFCPSNIRAKGLLIMTAMMSTCNIVLPATALVILPLDVHIPIFEGLVFTSWRLYIVLILIPLSLAMLLLSKLPETPKFLYTAGKHEEALEVIKSIYAVNQKKNKAEFPITSLSLNSDEINAKIESDGNQFINYFKKMMRDIATLFSKKYVIFTLMSCFLLFSLVGTCNTLIMWFPEETNRVMRHFQTQEIFNVTICDLMEGSNTAVSLDCNIKYDFMYAGILLGIAEMTACIIVGLWGLKIDRKILICVCSFLTAGICFLTVFLASPYVLIVCLASMIVLLFTMFPVIVSIIVELFPTQLRSSAASLTMTFSRMGSGVGGQILGILFENHCRAGHFGLTFMVAAAGILCIFIPTGAKKNHNKV